MISEIIGLGEAAGRRPLGLVGGHPPPLADAQTTALGRSPALCVWAERSFISGVDENDPAVSARLSVSQGWVHISAVLMSGVFFRVRANTRAPCR